VKVAAATDHDVAYWLGSAYLLQGPASAGARLAAKVDRISVMKTISGLSQIQTGLIFTTTRVSKK